MKDDLSGTPNFGAKLATPTICWWRSPAEPQMAQSQLIYYLPDLSNELFLKKLLPQTNLPHSKCLWFSVWISNSGQPFWLGIKICCKDTLHWGLIKQNHYSTDHQLVDSLQHKNKSAHCCLQHCNYLDSWNRLCPKMNLKSAATTLMVAKSCAKSTNVSPP